MRTDQGPLQRIRPYVRLALLEASRLEESGDLAGAWRVDRAVLRASRHAGRHGGTIQRLMGGGILRQSRTRIEAWAERPGMTAEVLRRAIGDVEACRAMTSPASEMLHFPRLCVGLVLLEDGPSWAVSLAVADLV